MDFFNQMLNSTQTSFDPLNFIGIIATVIASLYIFKGETSISFIKERHDNLICPLFDLLEPIMYVDFRIDVLKRALKIIEKNKNLADGKLLEIYYFCTKNPSEDNFKSLCAYIDSAYDKSCRKLGLKTRGITYRIIRRQYKSKLHLVGYIALITLVSFAVGFFIFFLFLLFIGLFIAVFESSNQTNQIIMMMVILLLGFALTKYMQKHP